MADRTRTCTNCALTGCGRPHCAFGWCEIHYRRWKRHGDPTVVGGTNQYTPRYPAAPLIAAVERRGGLAACADHRTRQGIRLRRAFYRAKQRGWVPEPTADTLAINLLGLTPGELWDEVSVA